MNIVEVRNLGKDYPSFHLQDVTISIRPGRITGFVGRNGAGKTSTIKSMLNLVHPDRGEINFFGLPFKDHEAEIKKRIGYSTGTVSWYPRKTIREITAVTRTFYPGWDEEACRRPTSGLDPFSRDELLGIFTELKEHGVAVFFSTHITSDLEKCADDIVYISNGKIIAAQPKAEFVAEYSREGESLEDTILRLERSMKNA